MHDVAATVAEYVPGIHTAHDDVAATLEEYVPTLHALHVSDVVLVEYPDAHDVQYPAQDSVTEMPVASVLFVLPND